MKIEIRPEDEALAKDLHDTAPSMGLACKATREICLSVGSEEIIILLLTIPVGVTTIMIADWLKSKIAKHKPNNITINKRTLEVSARDITVKQIEETINYSYETDSE